MGNPPQPAGRIILRCKIASLSHIMNCYLDWLVGEWIPFWVVVRISHLINASILLVMVQANDVLYMQGDIHAAANTYSLAGWRQTPPWLRPRLPIIYTSLAKWLYIHVKTSASSLACENLE